MSDLIRREDVIKLVNQFVFGLCKEQNDEVRKTFNKYIEKMPTAYDIDKVVEKLEEERELSYADFDKYVEEVSPCLDSEYDDFYHRGLERAVKIVKQGGVSDDVCEWKYNDSEYYFESSCEHLHIFMSDGPKENNYKFCPYCGKKIKMVE